MIFSSLDVCSSLIATFLTRTAKLSHDSSVHQAVAAAAAWAAHHEVVSVVEDMEVMATAAAAAVVAAVAVNSTCPMFVSHSGFLLFCDVTVNMVP